MSSDTALVLSFAWQVAGACALLHLHLAGNHLDTGGEETETEVTWRMDGSRGRGRVTRVGLGRHSGREFHTSARASSLHSSRMARGVETVGRGVWRARRA